MDRLHPEHRHDPVNALARLIGENKDAIAIFERAARLSADEEWTKIFRRHAESHQEMASDLRRLASNVGAPYRARPSLIGRLRLYWVSVRGMLAAGTSLDLVDECVQVAGRLAERYEDVLCGGGLLPKVRFELKKQHRAIGSALSEFQQYEEELRLAPLPARVTAKATSGVGMERGLSDRQFAS
ncbi:MAG: PA2169 family four-helix-bundle protein [Verrucomicrobiaceae bacterium]